MGAAFGQQPRPQGQQLPRGGAEGPHLLVDSSVFKGDQQAGYPRRAECVPLAAPAASTHVICRVLDSACEEVTDHCRDLLRMGLEREMARIEELDYRTGNIAPERLSTDW